MKAMLNTVNTTRYLAIVFIMGLISTLQGQSILTVNKVGVELIAPKTTSEELVLSNVSVKPGMTYSQPVIDQSIRSLYSTGYFQFIEVRVDETAEAGKVNVFFIVQSKYRLTEVKITGNEEISTRKVRKELSAPLNEPLDELAIKKDADAVRDYYRKAGFSQAEVTYKIDKNNVSGAAVATIIISEDRKVKIKGIEFTGIGDLDPDDLRDEMETETRGIFSWITGSGRLNENEFYDDLGKLRDYLKEQGYLDSTIDESKVSFDYKDGNKLFITIPVNLGVQYKFGEVTFENNTLFETELLQKRIPFKAGDVYRPSLVDEATGAVRDVYGSKGYLNTRVRAERQPDLDTANIGLTFSIREGELTQLQSISIDGNTKTKNIVIMRELALQPGEVFDEVRMRASESRLRNTQFFQAVSLSPEPTNVPGRSDLRIQVQEAPTGSINFGAGFGSVNGATIFAEVSQSNFDIQNPKSFFQGDGQKFRFRAELGTRSNAFNIYFEEPWIFERELAGGVDLYRTDTQFNSNSFDEIRTGAEFFLRKRLFERVIGRLSYGFEQVEITELEEDVSEVIREEEGTRTVSKVSLNLTRDTRDAFITTTRGNRVSWNNQLAGTVFGAETDYWKTELRGAQFWPVFKRQKQVFSLLGRAGVVVPLSGDRVPFFDRFFLGGPNSLRGFDFREVGPVDADDDNEPIGGNSYALISAEYSFELIESIRMAFFYDGGVLNSEEWDFGIDQYNDNVGFGFRVNVLGSPLRLDFGFPIQTEEFNDQTMQFHFSFGARF